ncbi:hypothetical protein GCM10020254_00570 [Streptomyces goshikiensis]
MYDPYVRGGEFLAESVAVSEGVRTMHPEAEPVKVFGQTTSPDAALLASLNLALRGVRPRVRLVREAPWAAVQDGEGPAADLVLTNPPFNMKDSAGEACRTGTWAYGAPPLDNDNLAYAQHVLASLRPGGRAAIVMPNKAGNSRSGAETAIRGRSWRRASWSASSACPPSCSAARRCRCPYGCCATPPNRATAFSSSTHATSGSRRARGAF